MKADLEFAVLELVFTQKRLIHPPIGVGVAVHQMMGVVAMHEMQLQPHSARRLAMHRIQNMRRQASTGHYRLLHHATARQSAPKRQRARLFVVSSAHNSTRTCS